MKSKTTAALLAFFLGGIGVHRFYLNQVGLGFLYLVFCWTLIPACIAFIDFIVFLVRSENDFNLKYNAKYMQYIRNTNVQRT
jgi:TM2 domain-containing membrane protein YozV